MQKTIATLTELKLVGITTRTNNTQIFERDPSTNKIAATVQKYFHNGLAEKISSRKNPGTTFCVYTNYESDVNGDYTYFIGEEVTSFEEIDKEFETLTIPVQNYAKFTNQPGPMPTVCIDMWQNIWKMNASDLGGVRSYIADFEVYDERSHDHNNVTLDIYIGIKKISLEHTSTPASEDVDFLTQKINQETPEFGEAHPFAFFIRDEKNKIIAGCNGSVIFGSIYTDQLWVHPNHRKNGLGHQLMEAVHDFGRKSGCSMATVATMSFQGAKSFYEKLGYVSDFERPGYTQNSSCIFLKRSL